MAESNRGTQASTKYDLRNRLTSARVPTGSLVPSSDVQSLAADGADVATSAALATESFNQDR